MSKHTLVKTISRELSHINAEIDWKIIKGIPYKREAKRHKFLVSMLQDVGRASASSPRFFSFLF